MDRQVDDRFGDLNKSAGKARVEAVLLNIARASERTPLTFVAFQKVSGGLTATVSAASPAFSLGPHGPTAAVQRDISIGNSTLGGSSSATNSMDLTIIESQEFYHSLLDPGDLVTFFHFLQGYPRELLFWIFVDSVRISAVDRTKPEKKEIVELQNSVFDRESCRDTTMGRLCFRHMVELAMLLGVTIQPKELGFNTNAALDANNAKNADSKNTASQDKSNTARICIDPFLKQRTEIFIHQARRDYKPSAVIQKLMAAASASPNCYSPFVLDRNYPGRLILRSVTPNRIYQYEIIPRSTFAIYQYLGRILGEGKTDKMVVTGLEPETLRDRRILNIVMDRTTNCEFTVTLREQTYCVPNENSELTDQVFHILIQLMALKLRANDIGLSPTLRATLQ